MNIIEIKELAKKFKNFAAVDGISFDVAEGEIFGLLGPNGAGKTTTIKMLTTLLLPTSGSATLAGIDIAGHRDEVREKIGMVFQDPALDRQMTGRENLEFHAWMYDMPIGSVAARIKEVLELVDMSAKADELTETYSGGMKRRLEIARGLMHYPKVLFLDEPTLGLDTQTRRKIWEYIQILNKTKNITIILTTHYMEEADFLCERVGIMDHGKIVAIDSPANLKEIIGSDVVTLDVECGGQNECKEFKDLDFVKAFKKEGDIISLNVQDGESKMPVLMEFARSKGIKIRRIGLAKPSLEDVFIKYTGTKIKDGTDEEN